MQGILKIDNFYHDYAVIGHGGGTLGFSAQMYWLDKLDIIVVLLTNVGVMHSNLKPSPVGMFYKQLLLPAVLQFFTHYPLRNKLSLLSF